MKRAVGIGLAVCFAASMFVVHPAEAAEDSDSVLRAGVAAVDITPGDDKVLDRLFAKAVVLLQGDEHAALVICDLIGVSPHVTEPARKLAAEKTGIPAAHVAIAATHTHNGRGGPDDLPDRMAQAVIEAHAAAQPVQLETGTTRQVETISFNRRYLMKDGTVRFNPGPLNPDIVRPVGPIDPEVGVVLLRGSQGRPIASLVNFALHACTVGHGGISADYPHFLEQTLRRELGERLLCLYLPGACGDVNHFDVDRPRPGMSVFQGQTFLTPYVPKQTDNSPTPLTYQYIGESLGATVKAALPKLAPAKRPALAARSEVVHAPLATYSEMDLAWAKEAVEQPISFLAGVRARRILALEELRKQGDTIPLELQAFRLSDDAAIVCLPGELFVELGLALKKASPFATTLVVELSGTARIAYVPTRKAFVEGEYEVVNSRLESGGGEMMVQAAVRMLQGLKERP
jgi:hypothetical protein